MIHLVPWYADNILRKTLTITDFVSSERCQALIDAAESCGEWTTDRHAYAPTTDIPIGRIDIDFSEELDAMVEAIRTGYSLAATDKLSWRDLFVVKYDDQRREIPLHRDGSVLSFVLTLSEQSEYTGGGTYYDESKEIVRGDRGTFVCHCGKRLHSGSAITSGIRYILIGFMSVESCMLKPVPTDDSIDLNFLRNDVEWLNYMDRRSVKTSPTRIVIRTIGPSDYMRSHTASAIFTLDRPDGWSIQIESIDLEDLPVTEVIEPEWRNAEIGPENWNKPIDPRDISIADAHQNAAKSTDADIDIVLTIQNGIIFPSDFLFRINSLIHELDGEEWDVINLNSSIFSGDSYAKPVDENFSLLSNCFTGYTKCLVWSKRGIARFARVDIEGKQIPFQDILNVLGGTHPTYSCKSLTGVEQPQLKVFTCKHDLMSESKSHEVSTSLHRSLPTSSSVEFPAKVVDTKAYYWSPDPAVCLPLDWFKTLAVNENALHWNFSLTDYHANFQDFDDNWRIIRDCDGMKKGNTVKLIFLRASTTGTEVQLCPAEPVTIKVEPGSILIISGHEWFKAGSAHALFATGPAWV